MIWELDIMNNLEPFVILSVMGAVVFFIVYTMIPNVKEKRVN